MGVLRGIWILSITWYSKKTQKNTMFWKLDTVSAHVHRYQMNSLQNKTPTAK